MIARGMFRIYQCSSCKNIGYARVEYEEDEARCSLCHGLVLHEFSASYAATIDEAREMMTNLAVSARTEFRKAGTTKGLGLKKRVFNIIEAVIEANRGRPASMEHVLRECNEAGINLDRASHFIEQLKQEGVITETGGRIVIDDGGVF